MGARQVIFDKVIEHKHSHKFRVEIFFFRQNSPETTMRNFEVIFDKISSDNVSTEITISYQA
jgi:hypothetical protein